MSVSTGRSAAAEPTGERSTRDRLLELIVVFHTMLHDLFGASKRAGEMAVMQAVKVVGAAVIGISVTVLVVNEVLTVDAINNTSGPFAPVIDSIGSTGVAAMTLLVIALLVLAASYIMGVMDRF